MNRSTKAVLVVAILLAASFLVIAGMNADKGSKDDVGLSSTKLSLASGETAELSPWILPQNSKSTDIQWSSDNTAVATVENGVVTAVSDGKANITATVSAASGTYSDTCEVTVSATPDHSVRAYDPYGTRYDYAILEGEGFLGTWDDSGNLLSGATLGISFNKGGFMAISATGYPVKTAEVDSYFSDDYYTGSIVNDYLTVVMRITGNGVDIAATHEYGCKESYMFTDSNGITYNSTAYAPVAFVKGLPYGEYEVTFTMTDFSDIVRTVTGTFTYVRGDGKYDTNFEYTRHYVWRSDIRTSYDDYVNSMNHTVDISYCYSDYWNSLLLTIRNSHAVDSSHWVNSQQESDCVGLVKGSKSVSDLAVKLRAEFAADYPALSTDGQYYAQYLLGFVQAAYSYEYDYYTYGNCGKDGHDYDIWCTSDLTLYTGLGDCEDTSILLSDLYKQSGFRTALLILSDHMMATVSVSSYTFPNIDTSHIVNNYTHKVTYEGRSYYFAETTVPSSFSLREKVNNTGFVHYSPVAVKMWIDYDPVNDYCVSYYLGFISKSYENTEYHLYEV